MKVLITGGTSFIGSRLALRLLANGDTVRVTGSGKSESGIQNKQMLESQGVEVVLGTVTEPDHVAGWLKGIEVVYHLAAAHQETNVPDQYFHDVNVTGTQNMLEASIQAGVRRFVYASTIGVYGSGAVGTLDENTPTHPDNIYGITKLAAEKLVLSYQDRLPVVAIRISEVYGPGDRRRLLKLFRAIKKRRFFVIGDGQNLHHVIYIDDLIDGLILAAQVEQATGQVFVMAGKEKIATDEMVAAIAEVLNVPSPRFRAPMSVFMLAATIMETVLRPLGIQPPLHRRRMDFFKKSFALSTARAEDVLGFAPRYTFKQGAAETARWYDEMNYL
jgi:dihydroflavonol-4-reductase